MVEYECPADKTPEVVRLEKLRMPVPTGVPDLGNPIKQMLAAGVGAPVHVDKISVPQQDADGNRCFVHFKPIEGATAYDVWVSPYADGAALCNSAKPGQNPTS